MATYTVTLTDAEDQALSYAALSQQEWIQGASAYRANVAVDEIVNICVQQCITNNIQIPGSKDEMVSLAFSEGWVKSAAERQAEAEAEALARAEQESA